jgi:hypothetical protein
LGQHIRLFSRLTRQLYVLISLLHGRRRLRCPQF